MIAIEWSDEGRKEVFAAYVKAQAAMGAVVKGETNEHFNNKYADLATVIEAVIPAFNKSDLAVIQSPSFDGETVSIETFIAHTGGGYLRSVISMRPTKGDPQGIGSTITYGRRYALLALAGVAPEDDDGNAASSPGEPGKKFERRQASPNGVKRLSSAQAKERGLDTEIKNQIDGCTTLTELAEWDLNFDKHTEQCPLSWLDAIHNQIILRKEDIVAEQGDEALDAEYREVVS